MIFPHPHTIAAIGSEAGAKKSRACDHGSHAMGAGGDQDRFAGSHDDHRPHDSSGDKAEYRMDHHPHPIRFRSFADRCFRHPATLEISPSLARGNTGPCPGIVGGHLSLLRSPRVKPKDVSNHCDDPCHDQDRCESPAGHALRRQVDFSQQPKAMARIEKGSKQDSRSRTDESESCKEGEGCVGKGAADEGTPVRSNDATENKSDQRMKNGGQPVGLCGFPSHAEDVAIFSPKIHGEFFSGFQPLMIHSDKARPPPARHRPRSAGSIARCSPGCAAAPRPGRCWSQARTRTGRPSSR
ncbi:MAG: hypothetical protein JWO82_616 [Akkermansiaceae bacterium]|nr:hypothetical protein [Akkermansiaceae bacterium]